MLAPSQTALTTEWRPLAGLAGLTAEWRALAQRAAAGICASAYSGEVDAGSPIRICAKQRI